MRFISVQQFSVKINENRIEPLQKLLAAPICALILPHADITGTCTSWFTYPKVSRNVLVAKEQGLPGGKPCSFIL
jgi:hypothetical protein